MLSLVVTNACNLSCGGCHQFCGHFSKEEIWFVSLDNFEKEVQACTKWADEYWKLPDFPNYNKNIVIYGGEPLLHPQWNDLCDIMRKYKSYNFLVYTNGLKFDKMNSTVETRYFKDEPYVSSMKAKPWSEKLEIGNKIKQIHKINCTCSNGNLEFVGFGNMFDVDYDMGNSQTGNLLYRCSACSTYTEACVTPPKTYRTKREQNIQYLVCEKDKQSLRAFIPTLVAPVDFGEEKPKEQYWPQAKENCYIWNECESSIYNDKAYFCIVAAAMDHLFYNGKYGWEVDPNKNPMDRTEQEIKEQAINFCYRCGFCFKTREEIDTKAGKKQLACNKTLCSSTNFIDIKRLKKIERI